MTLFSKEALEKIEGLNHLSIQLNRTRDNEESYTLKSMQEHVREIRKLFGERNPHWAVEAGDLMVHCMKILVLNGCDLNEILEECFKRFETKIQRILKANMP